jgi:hypothetical protein
VVRRCVWHRIFTNGDTNARFGAQRQTKRNKTNWLEHNRNELRDNCVSPIMLGVLCFVCFRGVWFILPTFRNILSVTFSRKICLENEKIECSETSANINETPGKNTKVGTLDTEHGEC